MDEHIKNRIAKHWDNQTNNNIKKFRTRWWDSPTIIRHINQTICGELLDGWNAGGIKLLQQTFNAGGGRICSVDWMWNRK
ncbi:MAG: hypothetical protein NC321_06380 [Clostridium sp.]|nr:hypothetical protein [Clostridium sp.]